MSDKKETFENLMETKSFRINYNFNNFSNADAKRLWEYKEKQLDQKDEEINKLEKKSKMLETESRLNFECAELWMDKYEELEEENKRILECNKQFQNRTVYWMNEHDKIKNKYEPEILTIGEE